jgi:ribosomal protein S18 acetylase RimI-like enzyme
VIRIRRATPDDADAIAEVHAQSRRETYDPIFGAAAVHPTLDAQRAKWRQALAGRGVLHVAVDGERVVGFGHALDGTLTTLYVLAAHHRQGIGRRLLHQLLHDIQAQGHAELRFNVLARNANAIAFYESQGARLVERVIVEEHGLRAEDVVYVLPVGAARL